MKVGSFAGFLMLWPSQTIFVHEAGPLSCRAHARLGQSGHRHLALPGEEISTGATLARRRLYEGMSNQLVREGVHIGKGPIRLIMLRCFPPPPPPFLSQRLFSSVRSLPRKHSGQHGIASSMNVQELVRVHTRAVPDEVA